MGFGEKENSFSQVCLFFLTFFCIHRIHQALTGPCQVKSSFSEPLQKSNFKCSSIEPAKK